MTIDEQIESHEKEAEIAEIYSNRDYLDELRTHKTEPIEKFSFSILADLHRLSAKVLRLEKRIAELEAN